ncbi:4-carboxy-4-hydroxy-2-oxoadipate aldolase/oxaloacetate decarboxylase [Bradyrhizobium sp. LHD-71]|uniref:4-carboxy-4-hydroxy-2-oxoadipate aldolase/oxaloacetate decarboxylase n=1 Tax=Bradyrhizobium sp. LHD-71 TaxID=3072141 RepID=UPI00280FB60B|nr:4-carboxy-4-hydroxy-2-oxoadipate aldolase/oxaloacetate decarboxylase [Bradyrhizobium sp. LHD-71]MDQ8730452.1 4-carboxy-4-hydroxy-2-oxoadipate aldolase/oxaloacetate decarboxylase [Bradyrhizobium sp. LHD-71]
MYGHIFYQVARPEPEILVAFLEIPTATLSDSMGRHGALASDIRPMYEGIRMVGAALTVLCFPGDNLMTHKALQMVQPGDVLIVDDGNSNTGCFGHRSALAARARGGVGAVVSGSIRDVAMLRQEGFPVFARGVSPRAPQKNTPGSINVPVHVGGIVVCPGDIVVGDDDGVVVVPRAMAKAVLEKARFRDLKEKDLGSTATGELPLDPSGAALSLDDLLAGKVVEHHGLQSWSIDLGAAKP